MKKEGQITVFLSVVMICICALMAGLLESARTAGAKWYLRTAANSALDSVMSQYHRELWENYHILMREYGDEGALEANFKLYLDKYLEAENFYPMGVESCQLSGILTAVDAEGKLLEQEILDYMKYGAWKLEKEPTAIKKSLEDLMEAGNVKDITSAYSSHTKEAFKLEQILDQIGDSVGKQREYYADGASALRSHSGSAFRKAAKKLSKELIRIPKLRAKYERQADSLKENLNKTEEENREKNVFLRADTAKALEKEISCYEEYVDEDGKRREEIAGQEDRALKNGEIVEDTLNKLEEIEDIIDGWDEEEDGYLDETYLWNSVLQTFEGCRIIQIECSHGVKDQKKKKALEAIGDLIKFDILNLVVPEGKQISQGVIPRTDFPSSSIEKEWDMEFAWKDYELPAKLETESLAKNVVLNEYAPWHFTDFLWDTVRPEEKKEVQYEMEYIISGKNTDEENLEVTAKRLLFVREGMNLIHIMNDDTKREEANQVAAAIVGYTGMAPLVAITAFFVMGIWALAEAFMDVKLLLTGKNVPFLKKRENWKIDLDHLFDFKSLPNITEENQEGMNYEGYLKLFLLLQDRKTKCFRYMDVMQMNIRRNQEKFLMKKCAYKMEFTCSTSGRIRQKMKAKKSY